MKIKNKKHTNKQSNKMNKRKPRIFFTPPSLKIRTNLYYANEIFSIHLFWFYDMSWSYRDILNNLF